MKIACLCPTYGRPALVKSLAAQIAAQVIPDGVAVKLFVWDDLGDFIPVSAGCLEVISSTVRFPNLPTKYLALKMRADRWGATHYAITEDDDVYSPEHVGRIAAAFQAGAKWCKPSRIWTTHGGIFHQEDATGRFYASTAFGREIFDAVGGFAMTGRMDFDLQFLAKLSAAAPPADIAGESPTYCFRWQDTGSYHAQGLSTSPDDSAWYGKIESMVRRCPQPLRFAPELDDGAAAVINGMINYE